MAERPLLAMPRPERQAPKAGRPPRENIPSADAGRQAGRLGPKFERLERALDDPEALGELRDDPSAIVPERALVFEVASKIADFYRAVRGVSGLEFLGEDEGDAAPDEDFYVPDKDGDPREDKRVPRRFYFTIPDQTALRELVSLWQRFQRGEVLGRGRTAWRDVFGHLADVRPWGPRDRLTAEAVEDWRERLQFASDTPIRFEVEFWYRDDAARRETAETKFTENLRELGGRVLDRAVIGDICYHAALVEVSPKIIRDVLDHPDVGLVAFDAVMMLRPQSMVSGPVEDDLEDAAEAGGVEGSAEADVPVAALLDGVPMAQHKLLANRLVIDDPDSFANKYGAAGEQRHGTAMASLILHGDLNTPNPEPPIRRPLYVRPVMYPQPYGFGDVREAMPPDRLCIDLIWRVFIRMFDGEGGEDPTAPTVCIVNLSLGDAKRRFAGVMSPWARLIDRLAWRHNVLILVSAGNITERVPLENVDQLTHFENADADERQAMLLRSILRQRANRRLLAPSEAVNALTVGAAHNDNLASNGQREMTVDPYTSPALPNMSSALGLGFKRAIKPEILFPGGSEQVRASSTHAPIEVSPVTPPGDFFGIGVASPGPAGVTNRKGNMSGTSVATALATHNALRILEALEDLPEDDPAHPEEINRKYLAVVLKALLVHSARWDRNATDALKKTIIAENGKLHWEHERDEVSRFLGFGCPDIERVVDCAENRATLIGWNTIGSKETDRFAVPLPAELEGTAGFRALSVTIAWLTPITHLHRMYRLAKFQAGPSGDEKFSIGASNAKQQPSYNALGKGAIYHRRWEGEEAAEFVDDGNLVLDITCLPAAGELDDPITYAVVATLEVGQNVAVPVYERVRERLREIVRVPA
ncbi:MAG: S8 family peptidase [Rhodospirillales bacterium]|nr:S8 family peptidase [Rhodospirillales bacterium]